MLYPPGALERAMTIREVVLRAMSGEITWIQAAEIIGCTPRSVRRWRGRFARDGYFGLLDRRRGRPSPRRAPFAEGERFLPPLRPRSPGLNARHFYQMARREHGVTLSYTYVKTALQKAGLLPKHRARGRHRRRREPRPCWGELVHLESHAPGPARERTAGGPDPHPGGGQSLSAPALRAHGERDLWPRPGPSHLGLRAPGPRGAPADSLSCSGSPRHAGHHWRRCGRVL